MSTRTGQTDVRSSEEAYRLLLDVYHGHKQLGVQDDDAWRDLTAGALTPGQGFPWHHFLIGRPWGRSFFPRTSVILTWREAGPALRVTTEARPRPSHISWRGSRAILSSE